MLRRFRIWRQICIYPVRALAQLYGQARNSRFLVTDTELSFSSEYTQSFGSGLSAFNKRLRAALQVHLWINTRNTRTAQIRARNSEQEYHF